MEFLLLLFRFLTICGPAIALAAPVVLIVVAGCRRRLSSPVVLVFLVLTSLVAMAATYLVGYFSDWIWLESDRGLCALRLRQSGGAAGAWTGLERQALPIRRTCEYTGGTELELVPPWVNPLICAYAAVVLACLTGPFLRARRVCRSVIR